MRYRKNYLYYQKTIMTSSNIWMKYIAEEKQKRIARETLEIYVPIAGLLGISRLKWQMEDICFKYLYPEKFNELEYRYEVERKLERQRFFQKVKRTLIPRLEAAKID